MNAKQAWSMVKQATSSWSEDRAPSMGAALSYYTVFSIAPLLLIVIAVAGLVFGQQAAQGAIVGQLQGLLGESAAQTIQGLLQSVSEPKEGVVATAVGAVLLLLGATTVFAELQDDLNRIWKAPQRARPSGLWGWLRARILSLGMILGIGFLLLVSLVASAAIAALGTWWGPMFGAWETLAQAVNFVLSLALVTGMFALIYRFMPDVEIQWHDVWVGAAVTALLFTIGKFAIGLYIGKSSVASGFGAAGSLAVLLLWVYYSAQIFLLGAEFTRVYAHQYGSRRARTAAAPATAAPDAADGTRPAAQTSPAFAAHRQATAAPRMGQVAATIQNHLLPAIGIAAALGALTAWTMPSARKAAARRRPVPTPPPTRNGRGRAVPTTGKQAAKRIAGNVTRGAAALVVQALSGAAIRGFKQGLPLSRSAARGPEPSQHLRQP